MVKYKILSVFGTRPEAIKMAPVVTALAKMSDIFTSKICVTAQHREMVDQVIDVFGLKIDYDLNVMTPNQNLFGLTTKLLTGMRHVLESEKPDLVLVHGDTSTTFVASLAAFYLQIPIAHVEAGLRTGNLYSPWPEEANRRLTGALADLHFAPTALSRQNLLRENVREDRIFVTGNTVIDALFLIRERISADAVLAQKCRGEIGLPEDGRRVILVTGHRRENFGPGFQRVISALRRIAARHPEVLVIFPVHLNPAVNKPVHEALAGIENIRLIEPLSYVPFVYLMNRSELIITDSGGVQEEAPSLGKPVLVTRETTERPEAVEAGTVVLVGTDEEAIVQQTTALLETPELYQSMSRAINPYGDGQASARIVRAIAQFYGASSH